MLTAFTCRLLFWAFHRYYLILMSALWSRCCFYRHFTNDKTEAQRDEITYKISHRSGTARIWTQTAWHQNVHSYLLLLLLHATPPWLLEIPVYFSVLTSVTLKTPVWLDLLHHKEQMSFSIVSCRYYSFLGGRGSRKRSSKAMSKKKTRNLLCWHMSCISNFSSYHILNACYILGAASNPVSCNPPGHSVRG